MNSAEKEAVLHCLKAMIDEEVCEECPLYGTTGTDHCEKDCVRLAINELEQEPFEDATKHFKNVYELSQTLSVSYDFVDEKIQEMLMELKTKPLVLLPVTPQPCDDAISRQAVLDLAKFDGRENLGSIIHAFDVEQLPPVTPQPCEDAISRQEAIDALYKMLHDCFGADDEELDAVITTVNELSPVTPTEKVGHWIAQDIHNCHTDFRCSKCGYIHDFMHLYGKPTANYTYCPNCGAMMQEVEE